MLFMLGNNGVSYLAVCCCCCCCCCDCALYCCAPARLRATTSACSVCACVCVCVRVCVCARVCVTLSNGQYAQVPAACCFRGAYNTPPLFASTPLNRINHTTQTRLHNLNFVMQRSFLMICRIFLQQKVFLADNKRRNKRLLTTKQGTKGERSCLKKG